MIVYDSIMRKEKGEMIIATKIRAAVLIRAIMVIKKRERKQEHT